MPALVSGPSYSLQFSLQFSQELYGSGITGQPLKNGYLDLHISLHLLYELELTVKGRKLTLWLLTLQKLTAGLGAREREDDRRGGRQLCRRESGQEQPPCFSSSIPLCGLADKIPKDKEQGTKP